jgi:hypothetical protein
VLKLAAVASATAVSASLRVIFFISVVSGLQVKKQRFAVVGGNQLGQGVNACRAA